MNNLLEEAKKEYLETPLPVYLVQNGWDDVRIKLGSQSRFEWGFLLKRGIVAAGLILVFLGGTVGAAQAAKPGDGLYGVKVLADTVYAKVTGNYDVPVSRRADDVINVSKDKTDQGVDSAKKEYEKSLDNATKGVEGPGEKEDLKQTLSNQEDKFREEIERDPESGEHLRDVLKETERVRGEVKGDNDRRGDGENDGDRKSGHQDN